MSMPITSAGGWNHLSLNLASARDRKWLKKRPHRQFRLREPVKGEIPGDPSGLMVVVKMVPPGVRACLFVPDFIALGYNPSDDADLAELFERAIEASEIGFYPMTEREIQNLQGV